MPLSISVQSRTESKSIYKTKHVTSDIRARIVCGSHCYKHGSGTQGEEMTVNPQYQPGMQPVFRKSGVVGSTVEICTSSF